MCAIYIYWCFPLHLLVIFVTGPSLHCLEGNSLECSIRLSATHHPLCSDLHPSLQDGVHGPFYIFIFLRINKRDKNVKIWPVLLEGAYNKQRRSLERDRDGKMDFTFEITFDKTLTK